MSTRKTENIDKLLKEIAKKNNLSLQKIKDIYNSEIQYVADHMKGYTEEPIQLIKLGKFLFLKKKYDSLRNKANRKWLEKLDIQIRNYRKPPPKKNKSV